MHVVARFAVTALLLTPLLAGAAGAREIELPDASFEEDGAVSCDAAGLLACGAGQSSCWSCSGDVAVFGLEPPPPCLAPQLPSDGLFAACLSTGDLDGDGTGPTGGIRSDLISPAVSLEFRADLIKVSFEYEYGTDETIRSAQFNDTVSVTLLTPIGPLPMLVADTWGTTPAGRGLSLNGNTALGTPNPGCPVARQTGRVFASYKRGIPPGLSSAFAAGPIQVQFSVSNQGDADGLTFLCIDNVRITAKKRR